MTATEARIVAAYDELSPAHQRIARVVLDDRIAAALCSAEALGRRAQANPATIVRFSQALGFSGWAQLRETLRGEIPHLVTAVERLGSPRAATGEPADLDAAVIEQDARNIEETARSNTPELLGTVAGLLAGARRILVIGSGVEAPLADLLAVALRRAGRDAVVPGAIGSAVAPLHLAEIEPGDVVVGIAVWRYIADTTRLFDAAVAAGATGVAITDNRVAPLARKARHVLLASTDSPLLSHSMTGMLSLLNVLSSRVLALAPAPARDRLQRLDAMFAELEVFDA